MNKIVSIIASIVLWLRKTIPVAKDDKVQHATLMKFLVYPTALWGVVLNPLVAFWLIVSYNGLAILWEIPSLVKEKFTYAAFSRSGSDIAAGFQETLIPLALLYEILRLKGIFS